MLHSRARLRAARGDVAGGRADLAGIAVATRWNSHPAFVPALLAVFAYRLINLWLPMIPALAGIPTLRRLQGRRSRRKAGPSPA